jgi:di/tripeptidase
MSDLHYKPTAAELVAAVAEFLEGEVRAETTGAVNFHARIAANVLRTVERELLDDTAAEPRAALSELGVDDEATLAAAIRAGDFDARSDDVFPALRALVAHRLRVAHPGYEEINAVKENQ